MPCYMLVDFYGVVNCVHCEINVVPLKRPSTHAFWLFTGGYKRNRF